MKLTISIPKPCREDWNAMHARESGRFCDSCQHTVADLTRATDAELVALFTSDAKPKCARFDPAQLDRALGAAEERRSRAVPIAAFTSLVAIAAGHEAFAQGQGITVQLPTLGGPVIAQPAPPPPVVKGKMMLQEQPHPICELPVVGDTIVLVEPDARPLDLGQPAIIAGGVPEPPLPDVDLPAVIIEEPQIQQIETITLGQAMIMPTPPPADTVEICGTVVDESGQPASFTSVRVEGLPLNSTTDVDGAFRMRVPVDPTERSVSIDIRALGYMRLLRTFKLDDDKAPASVDAFPPMDIDPKDPLGIMGSVEDVGTGRMMPEAIVQVRGTSVRVRCDDHGRFALRIPATLKDQAIILEIEAGGSERMSIPLSAHAVPCCVPIKFKSEGATAPAAIKPECHDLGIIRLEERRYLTGMVAVLPERKASAIGRITAPLTRTWRKLTVPARSRFGEGKVGEGKAH